MRLYSKGQLIIFAGLCCLILGLLAFGVGLFKPFSKKTAEGAETTAAAVDAAPNLKISAPLEVSSRLQINAQELHTYTEDERENIYVYDTLNDAVVNITTETVALNWFLEAVPQDGGSGSGVIIDAAGFVLTNNHVIEKAIKVFVNLADGAQIEGTVVGTDADNDLAVLKFTPPAGVQLKTVPFGDSDNLKVGQKVMAIGNPFGFERTLTVGIISGLGRPIRTSNRTIIKDMIQTDASINPGNSGGPLLDALGKMIGVTTMIYSPSGGSVGIGLAVPVNTAKRVVAELRQFGKVRRGWIDATMVQLFPALVNYADLPVDKGLLVSRVQRGGLAEKAGLKQGTEAARYGSQTIYLGGDVITKVDGVRIENLADLYSALEDNKPAESVEVELIRNGKTITTSVTLADREETLSQ